MLDLQAIKSFLLKPALFGRDGEVPAAHVRHVTRLVGRLDALLKAVMAPAQVRLSDGRPDRSDRPSPPSSLCGCTCS